MAWWCTACGTANGDDAASCMICSARRSEATSTSAAGPLSSVPVVERVPAPGSTPLPPPPMLPGPVAPGFGPSRNRGKLWLAAVVAIVLIVIAVKAGSHSSNSNSSSGSGTDLSALHLECAGGAMSACDTLYRDASTGSDEETFGSTCGDTRTAQYGTCATSSSGSSSAYSTSSEPSSSGSSGGLDLSSLHSSCAGGDMSSCDALYREAPTGSDEETFGSTCGNTEPLQHGSCETNYGND